MEVSETSLYFQANKPAEQKWVLVGNEDSWMTDNGQVIAPGHGGRPRITSPVNRLPFCVCTIV